MNDKKKVKEVQAENGARFREKKVPLAYPYWCAAAVWIFAALFVRMKSIWSILIVAAVSFVVFWIAKAIFKPEIRMEEIPFQSGNADLDSLVGELDDSVRRIEAAGTALAPERPQTAEQLRKILSTVGKIRECLIKDPEDSKMSRRFLTYYLPSTAKLAEKYASTLSEKAETDSANKTLEAIDRSLIQIDEAFRRQYDALYENDRIDVTSDIAALETMLKQDNLA